MTNKPHGTLYTGVTSELPRRVWEHQEGIVEGFTKKYNLKKLVYYKYFDTIEDAICKEKEMKEWQRNWKIKRILEQNPKWNDLSDDLINTL